VVPGIALVGLVLIGLAVASATIWKPPETVTASHSAGSGASLLWTDPGVLEAWNDQVSIEVSTKTVPGVVVAIGRSNDVAKWVADSPFERITGLSTKDSFTVTNGGSTEQIVAAQGSDLWVASREVTSAQTISWTHKPGRWSLLIAPMEGADGEFGTMAGTTVSLTWTRVVQTPYLTRGITLGTALIAISLIVLVWEIRHRRRLDLVTERQAAREAGLQREAGPQIARRTQVVEETSVMKAVATALPDLEAGGQVAPAEPPESQPKTRRARLRHTAPPSADQPVEPATPQPAPEEPAVPVKATTAAAPPAKPKAVEASAPEVAKPEAQPARTKPPAPAKAPEPPAVPDQAPEPAPQLPEPVAAGEAVTALAAEGKPRRWFGSRKKPVAAEVPAEQVDQVEPAEALALNLGLATPQRRWEKLRQPDQAAGDQPEEALAVFGARVDPVLGPIAAPTSPPPVAARLPDTSTGAVPAAQGATPDQKIEALRAAHSSTASQAAATIAAAMAAAQGTGSAAGLTRRQIREAERAAHDALRAHRQDDLPMSPHIERPVKMQGEDSE